MGRAARIHGNPGFLAGADYGGRPILSVGTRRVFEDILGVVEEDDARVTGCGYGDRRIVACVGSYFDGVERDAQLTLTITVTIAVDVDLRPVLLVVVAAGARAGGTGR